MTISYNPHVILKNWPIQGFPTLERIQSGTTCSAFLVHSCNGNYLLRCFSSSRRAELESAVYCHLKPVDVIPPFIPTHSDTLFFENDHGIFTLQQFISGTAPDLWDTEQLIFSASSIGKLHTGLRSCTAAPTSDRFDTIEMLQRAASDPRLYYLFPNSMENTAQMVKYIQQLEACLNSDQPIHADLGVWNTLWDGTKVWIIDFGEYRLGDFHFDLAAFLSGLIRPDRDLDSICAQLCVLLSAYEKYGSKIDSSKLMICLYFWFLRGALATLLYISDAKKQDQLFARYRTSILLLKEIKILI